MNIINRIREKLNFINRYVIYVIFSLIYNLVIGYDNAELGVFAIFGGLVLAPLSLLVFYFFGLILTFIISTTEKTFKSFLIVWHKSALNIALIIYDLLLLVFPVMILTSIN